jgi:hypothetical protein
MKKYLMYRIDVVPLLNAEEEAIGSADPEFVKFVAQWDTAFGLAMCGDHNLSEMREEVLQGICKDNPKVREAIEQFRRENQ